MAQQVVDYAALAERARREGAGSVNYKALAEQARGKTPTLAQMVRAKHPGAYADLTDQELDQLVRAKFPGAYDDVPAIGDDVTNLMGPPPVGSDVTALMGGDLSTNPHAGDPSGRRVLSYDPNAGEPLRGNAGAPRVLSTDPYAGEPLDGPNFRTSNERDAEGRPVVRSIGESVTDFAKEATQGLNPMNIAESVQQSFWHPLETLSGVLSAQDALRVKGQDAFRRGDYVAGLRHFMEYALPFGAAAAGGVLGGPAGFAGGLAGGLYGSQRLSQAGDYMQEGETAKGLGATVDAATMGLLSSPRAARSPRPTLPRAAATPHQEMVQFGRERGIPLDAGTALDSQLAKNIQKKAGGTYGGANIIENAQARQSASLNRVGRELAEDVNATDGRRGRPVDAVTAGERVQSSLQGRIRDFDVKANAAYEQLRKFEDDPRSGGLAVDVRPARQALRPMYERLLKERELTGVMMGGKGRALVALDRLMAGPDAAPLSVVDAALSDLKAMARGAEMPELRTSGQGIAAEAVRQLDSQVRARAAQAGPRVLKALAEGRSATTAKYTSAEAMELLVKAEPRATFNALTAGRDLGLNKLRVLLKESPKEVPNVARGLLEDILERPTAEGGFKFADKAAADWLKLGGETKAILFPKAGQVKALNNFFRLAKRIGENPNPSGTANVSRAWALVDAVPGYAFAKVLYTPKGVQALTAALELKAATGRNARSAVRSGRALTADAAVTSQLAQAAKEAGVVLPFPKAAESADPRGQR